MSGDEAPEVLAVTDLGEMPGDGPEERAVDDKSRERAEAEEHAARDRLQVDADVVRDVEAEHHEVAIGFAARAEACIARRVHGLDACERVGGNEEWPEERDRGDEEIRPLVARLDRKRRRHEAPQRRERIVALPRARAVDHEVRVDHERVKAVDERGTVLAIARERELGHRAAEAARNLARRARFRRGGLSGLALRERRSKRAPFPFVARLELDLVHRRITR